MSEPVTAPVATPGATSVATAAQAEPGAFPSRATRVTFFEDRAEVVRRARLTVLPGTSWAAVAGVTALVDDPSVVARVVGDGPRVIAVRVVRRVRTVARAAQDELLRLEAAARAARVRRGGAERALVRAGSRRDRCLAVQGSLAEGLGKVPRGGAEGLLRWRAAAAALDRELSAALDEISARQDALLLAREDEERVLLRLREGQAQHPRYETTVQVQLDASSPGPDHTRASNARWGEAQPALPAEGGRERPPLVELELVYRTPCALWRPEHLARAVARQAPGAPGAAAPPGLEVGGHDLLLTSWATAWQATGEDWRDVESRFSTARPAQSASPPLLRDDVLVLRKKTEQEKRAVVVEAREQSIAVAGLSRGERVVDDMPGVDDGGEPLWFAAARPASFPSNGQPVRVEIASTRLPCTVDRVCFPERSAAAHLRATATLTGTAPLLAGPVQVARGSELFGRGRVSFVGKGEPFELGLGLDDGLRVRRHVEDKRDTAALLGTQKLTRTVKLYVSNLSGTRKKLSVIERVPVSEIREVEVAVISSGGARLDPKDGMARFEVEVAAGGTQELQLSYRIEAAAKVALDWL